MKKIWFFVLFLACLIALPLSNLLGLNGKNKSIPINSTASIQFSQVSKILQNKCVDCHSPNMTRMPIYANLPIAKQLIEKDIKEARQRFILNKNNYSGEESFSPLMLARLENVINNKKMPPALYLSMHWSDSLNSEERTQILNWIKSERAIYPWSKDTVQKNKAEPVQPLPLTTDLDDNKVALGDKLFHDTLLSGDNTLSCASCHSLTKGGTDQLSVATGIRGQQGPINSPTVFNAMYNLAQFWDGRAKDLQDQAAGPVANPGEMGAIWKKVIERLKQVPEYQNSFSQLYPVSGITKATVTDAIAIFEKSLLTPNSKFDRYLRGNDEALSLKEKKGYLLFKQDCASCHFGPALGGLSYEKMGIERNYFAMRGSEMTEVDDGRFNVTKREIDRHVFKVPVLRNIEVTYPYFHDGSINNLSEAILIMGAVQVGKKYNDEQVNQLVSFLKTLTGEYQGKLLSSK
ncbi:MAG: cytochrome c peroxidase [Methyloprofundus sp.]|nr:MAG: cytochrome c peroxidase [Methyloprofundus sp.]